MNDDTRNRIYLALAFTAGIAFTLGYKDLYPDLERRYRQHRRSSRNTIAPLAPGQRDHVKLEDHSKDKSHAPGNHGPATYEIKTGIEGTIGNTPLIRIKSLSDATGCEILAKAEFLNGAGNSPKDRVALSMIDMAEEEGLLRPDQGDVIYEGTVGSTGISLAAICRARGYKAHMYVERLAQYDSVALREFSDLYSCMPSDQATEKSNLLLKLGAKVERVPPASIIDTNQFVNTARRRAEEHTADPRVPGRGFFADQFENTANYIAHYNGTGPEIYAQTAGQLDAFVAGAGTGGTISGVAMYLKPRIKGMKVVLADPQGSGLFNKIKHGVMFAPTEKEGTRRRHQVDTIVEGIGVNRVTANFEAGRELVDDAIKVTDEQALKMARWLVENDGIFAGSSTAVNCELMLGIIFAIVILMCIARCRSCHSGQAARQRPQNRHDHL